ncbi:MAG: chromosome segregation protein SMC, partial [Clostridia bacterium]|nr:chromosome segregation protein SMC [Clostridia bacterium]
ANAAAQELESRGETLYWQLKDARDRLIRQREGLLAGEQARAQAEEKLQESINALRGFEMMEGVRRGKVEKAQAAADQLLREKHIRQDRLQLLQSMEREYEGFSFAVKQILQAGRSLSGIHGPLSALIRTSDACAVAIETALGAAMQNIVTEDEGAAKAAIGYLKAGKLGRATFLPLTAVRPRWSSRKNLEDEKGFLGYGSDLVSCDDRYRDILSSLLGTTAVVDHIDSAIAMGKKHKYAFRIVTLDGQIIQAGGAMTGGSTGKSTGVLSRANEMTRLEQEIRELEGQAQQARADLEKAGRELKALTDQMAAAQEERKTAEEALAACRAEVGRMEALAEAVQAEIDRLEQEKDGLGSRRMELTERVCRMEGEAAALTAKREELRKQLNQMTMGAESGRHEATELERRRTDLRMDISGLEAEARSLEQAAAMLESLLQAAGEESRDKQAAIDRTLAEIEALRRTIDDHSDAVSLAAKRRADAEQVIAKLTEDRLALEGRKTRTERDIQNRSSEILNQERLRASLEQKRNELQNEEKKVIDQLWDSYELTPGTARETYKKPVDAKRAEKRIGELRAAIRGLGSVNLDAVAEYEEVFGRYTFLCEQRDDLEQAKRDLTDVITRLTHTMEESFSEKFRQINASFAKTFEEIFGGGHAYLRLENEKDLLECGIEIAVEMPGKGSRAISLLSGGEKAFVAIALYFAIIKVSPTPFCVLDEIDAALDDVNVTRFTDYMRKL